MYRMMTPGPTEVPENVRLARARSFGNPDLDTDFVEEYKKLCEKISRLLHTENETLILGGEGILGLEAAVASLTEPGDRVLVLDNGEFGAGFADFVKIYRGNPVMYSKDRLVPFDVDELKDYLEQDHDFKYATVVHGDTPSGMLNDITKICPLLKSYGILVVTDAVSTSFGEPVDVDACRIDILCGGSQKALSAPPGLTFNVISEDAKQAIRDRKTPVASFYANLAAFAHYYEEKWFPYTMPISDIYGLEAAVDNIAEDPEVYERHHLIGEASRKAVVKAGLQLHLRAGYSDTVTVLDVPEGVTDRQILDAMKKEHNIMLAGSFGDLAGKVIRIGHMGNNARVENMRMVFAALDDVLTGLGVPLKAGLLESFNEALAEELHA